MPFTRSVRSSTSSPRRSSCTSFSPSRMADWRRSSGECSSLWPIRRRSVFSSSRWCSVLSGRTVCSGSGRCRPRRRSLALLVDVFALGLVMIALLFVVGTFDGPAFREIQRATLVVIGISPIVFLLGLLDARLGRLAVGDLVVGLRSDPALADLREALARA